MCDKRNARCSRCFGLIAKPVLSVKWFYCVKCGCLLRNLWLYPSKVK